MGSPDCKPEKLNGASLKDLGKKWFAFIVNMSADENVLTDGRVDLSKLQPVIYDSSNNNYRIVGDSVGQAWQSGKAIQDK